MKTLYEGGYFGTSTSCHVYKDSLGFFFFHRMSRCIDCKHVIDGSSHERCHTHADCAQGQFYYAEFCGICQDLWARSREYKDDPADAKAAFKILFTWVIGFGKIPKAVKQDKTSSLMWKSDWNSIA